MVATRRSARIASQSSQPDSSPVSQASPKQAAGSKRKSEPGDSPSAKRGKKDEAKEQKTLEETLPTKQDEQRKPQDEAPAAEKDVEMQEAPKPEAPKPQVEETPNAPTKSVEEKPEVPAPAKPKSEEKQQEQAPSQPKEDPKPVERVQETSHAEPKAANNTEDQPKQQAKLDDQLQVRPHHEEPQPEPAKPEGQTHEESKPQEQQREESKPTEPRHEEPRYEPSKQEEPKHEEKPEHQAKEDPKPVSTTTNGENAVVPDARTEDVPSSILEKGMIYFLYRGRVNINEPSNVGDIQRSYIVLRPIPHGAKLTDGPIGDDRNVRLIAVPKKVLPLSGKDRWIAFTEKTKTTLKELKDTFLGPSDYETQAGMRHTPAAIPAAEGVYAITSTGRESHLAYMMTLPTSFGELQNDLGLREKGSFITSVKNPKYPSPPGTSIGKDPEYSQEILDDFRALRWAPLQPRHLDYESCQFLLVGESSGIEKAFEPQSGDEHAMKPREEMEKLEGEDEIRVKHLHGDDAVFADLGIDSKNYHGMQTTW